MKRRTKRRPTIKSAISAVVKLLGNTPTVCRKCYIHPVVLETYLRGNFSGKVKLKIDETGRSSKRVGRLLDLRSGEAAILKLLGSRVADKPA